MIARNIVEKFDGKITFKSEKGIGSTFSFSFKLEGETIQNFIDIRSNDLKYFNKK